MPHRRRVVPAVIAYCVSKHILTLTSHTGDIGLTPTDVLSRWGQRRYDLLYIGRHTRPEI